MELDPVNISPLPAGMMLSFVNRWHQGATAEGRDLSLLGSDVLHSPSFYSLWELQCLLSNVDDFSSRQWPAASPTQLRHFSVCNSPRIPESRSPASSTGTALQPTYPPSREPQPHPPNKEEGLLLEFTVSTLVILATPHTYYSCILYSPTYYLPISHYFSPLV